MDHEYYDFIHIWCLPRMHLGRETRGLPPPALQATYAEHAAQAGLPDNAISEQQFKKTAHCTTHLPHTGGKDLGGNGLILSQQTQTHRKQTGTEHSPSSAAAYLGDRSWWLQYSPALAQAPSANASDMMPTIREVGPAPACKGVSTAKATMQSAGPAKAMPCSSVAGIT